jgi:hypothetical protein
VAAQGQAAAQGQVAAQGQESALTLVNPFHGQVLELGPLWDSMVAAALEPEAAGAAVAWVAWLFGDKLGFRALYSDPATARDQCICASDLFASLCQDRGIEAGTVSGYWKTHVPPFSGEVVGHTTATVPAPGGGLLAVDWTARQFDPAAPVPLIVPLADWQAFWSGCLA